MLPPSLTVGVLTPDPDLTLYWTALLDRAALTAVPYPSDTVFIGPPVLLTVDVYLVILPYPLRPVHVAQELRCMDTVAVLVTGWVHAADWYQFPAVRGVLALAGVQVADVLAQVRLAPYTSSGVVVTPPGGGVLWSDRLRSTSPINLSPTASSAAPSRRKRRMQHGAACRQTTQNATCRDTDCT